MSATLTYEHKRSLWREGHFGMEPFGVDHFGVAHFGGAQFGEGYFGVKKILG